MSGTSELVKFENTITWKIQNFTFRRMDQESTITSPKFMTRCVDVLTWSFDLYPNGKTHHDFIQFAAQLHFSGSRDVVDFYITSVDFDIAILDVKYEKKFETQFSFVPTFTEPKSVPIDFIPLMSFLEERHLYHKCFIVSCSITTSVNYKEFGDLMNSAEEVSVVRCVNELMESPRRTDLMVYSSENKVFPVHDCILRARCPTIFGNSEKQPNWFSGISTDVLKCLLDYVYGVTSFEVPRHLNKELLSVARKYKLLDLEKDLLSYPVLQFIETGIIVDEKEITIPLDSEMFDLDLEGREHGDIPISDRFNFMDLKVYYSIQDSVFKIDFDVSILVAGKHIFLKCLISLLDYEERVLKSQVHSRTFFANEVWTLTPHILSESVYNDLKPHYLMYRLTFSEGSFEDKSARNRIDFRNCDVHCHPFTVVNDLLSMFENKIHYDLKIETTEEVFFAHKLILEKRSRLLKEALDTVKGYVHTLRVPSMTARICKMALIYMYSGRINVSDRETAKDLEKAANYFHLPLLANKMSLFNSEHV